MFFGKNPLTSVIVANYTAISTYRNIVSALVVIISFAVVSDSVIVLFVIDDPFL